MKKLNPFEKVKAMEYETTDADSTHEELQKR